MRESLEQMREEVRQARMSDMNRAEAARLRNHRGKNYNGGKYDNPSAVDNPMLVGKVLIGLAIAIFLVSSG